MALTFLISDPRFTSVSECFKRLSVVHLFYITFLLQPFIQFNLWLIPVLPELFFVVKCLLLYLFVSSARQAHRYRRHHHKSRRERRKHKRHGPREGGHHRGEAGHGHNHTHFWTKSNSPFLFSSAAANYSSHFPLPFPPLPPLPHHPKILHILQNRTLDPSSLYALSSTSGCKSQPILRWSWRATKKMSLFLISFLKIRWHLQTEVFYKP